LSILHGDPQLLHQLIYKFNTIEDNFAATYYKYYNDIKHHTPETYKKHPEDKFVNQLEGDNNYIIVAERLIPEF